MKVISIDLGATSGRVMTVSYEEGKISYEENYRFENRTYLDEKGILLDSHKNIRLILFACQKGSSMGSFDHAKFLHFIEVSANGRF